MDAIIGTWQLGETEGFEEFAKAFGLDDEKIQMFKKLSSKVTYSRDGDTWTVQAEVTGYPPMTYNYKMGVPFETVSLTGDKLEVTADWNGERFVEKYRRLDKDVSWTGNRVIKDNTIIAVSEFKGVKMTQKFNKV